MSGADIVNICGATKRQGDKSPCRRPAGAGTDHPGFGSCKLHAGSTPGGVKHAERERALWEQKLIEQIDPSLALLMGLRDDPDVPSRDRIMAARDLLDRAGARIEEKGGSVRVVWEVTWPE